MRWSAHVVIAVCCSLCVLPVGAATVCPATQQRPVVFMGGLLGSVLDAKLNIPASAPGLPHARCARNDTAYSLMWLKVGELTPLEVVRSFFRLVL